MYEINEEKLRAEFGALLDPVEEQNPCGPDLEYDLEYMALFTLAEPQKEVKVIDDKLVESELPPSWSEVDRKTRILLGRSKDLRLMELLTRSMVQLRKGNGLEYSLHLLIHHLENWGGLLHPRPGEDEKDSQNAYFQALQSFASSEGLLKDIRVIPLISSTASQLKVGDVERSLAPNRPANALPPEAVQRQLAELRTRAEPNYQALARCAACVGRLEALLEEQYSELNFKPDLRPLADLLKLLRHIPQYEAPGAELEETQAENAQAANQPAATQPAAQPPAYGEQNAAPGGGMKAINDRYAAAALIRQARCWFEDNEPSSPVPILLKQAEAMVGKSFLQTVQTLPLDIMEKWGADQ